MEKNYIKSVIDTMTTGCSNAPGGDCHFRREYELLKDQFSVYKANVNSELERLSITEQKFVLLEKQTKVYKETKEEELEDLRQRNKHLEKEIPAAYERGYADAEHQYNELRNFHKGQKEAAEAKASSAEAKACEWEKRHNLIVKSLERATVQHEAERQGLLSRTKELEKDMEMLKEDVQERMGACQSAKNRAMDDYLSLQDMYNEMKLELEKVSMKLNGTETEKWKLETQTTKLTSQMETMKQKEEEINRKHQHELGETRLTATRLLAERVKHYEQQLSWTTAKFAGISAELRIHIESIQKKLEEPRKRSTRQDAPSSANLDRDLLYDVLYSLRTIAKEQDEAAKMKEKAEKEMGKVADTLRNSNKELHRCCTLICDVFSELSGALGMKSQTLDTESLDKQMLLKETRTDDENAKEDGEICELVVVELKKQEHSLKVIAGEVKVWSEILTSQRQRLVDRKNRLQDLLNDERLARIQDKEESDKKLHIYKTLVKKLKARLMSAIKPLDQDYLPPSKFFKDEGEEQTIKVSEVQEKLIEFRVMLDKAEEKIEGTEAFELKKDEHLTANAQSK